MKSQDADNIVLELLEKNQIATCESFIGLVTRHVYCMCFCCDLKRTLGDFSKRLLVWLSFKQRTSGPEFSSEKFQCFKFILSL